MLQSVAQFAHCNHERMILNFVHSLFPRKRALDVNHVIKAIAIRRSAGSKVDKISSISEMKIVHLRLKFKEPLKM